MFYLGTVIYIRTNIERKCRNLWHIKLILVGNCGQNTYNLDKNGKKMFRNRTCGLKSKYYSKIGSLKKVYIFRDFIYIWSQMEIFVKNRKFGQKSKFW